jgi:acetyl-CoA carboxylase carboxyltransferase component
METDQKHPTEEKIRLFEEKKAALMKMGGEKLIQKQHSSGKLTARERLDVLFDMGTFQEVQLFVKHRSALFGLGEKVTPGDGVITGFGLINGAEAPDPNARPVDLVRSYEEQFKSPCFAAGLGAIDEIIPPKETRRRIAVLLETLKNKMETRLPKKHNNILP